MPASSRLAALTLVVLCSTVNAGCGTTVARPAISPMLVAWVQARQLANPAVSAPLQARVRRAAGRPSRSTNARGQGSGPLPGGLLIADKGNNRLLLVDNRHRIVWQFPGPAGLAGGQQFLLPDDAFFSPDHRSVIATEEDYHVVREIDVKSGRITWQYGHPGVPGSGPGYLNGPDDAYWVKGRITLADIRNCRILILDARERIAAQYGRTGVCIHDPPRAFAAPNGDAPLPDGGMLVSDIGGSWIDRLDGHGRLLWTVHSPLQYPSDPQLLPDGTILICDYTLPGRVVELGPHGRVVASFGASSGPNLLDHPSLAIRLPNGLIALNDDWNHRVILVDMRNQRIVWQYGVTGRYGRAPGLLDNPDGIDFLPAPD